MPWKETCVMDQRVQFIADWLSGEYTKIALCAHYGISRPTGNKWIARYRAEDGAGLTDRCRAPHTHPNAVPQAVCDRIIAAKLAKPSRGPRKLMAYLRTHEPQLPWPVDSTAGEILKRAGLVRPRRRRRRVAPYTQPFAECQGPNHTWSADFKGDFQLGNGQRCHPLTLSDNFSRYLLQCRGLVRTTYWDVRPWFEWVFREYGLPRAIRTDNGPPFASLALGGLSQLSVWWIRLAIIPERIRPGKPSQNGRHERLHETLNVDGVHPIQFNLPAQQRQFDVFTEDYNFDRPHEALGQHPPASAYQCSPRRFPGKLPAVEYDSGVAVRKVRHNGEIKWRGQYLYLAKILAREPVALEQVDGNLWRIRYSFHVLGQLDERTGKITPAKGWHGTQP